MTLDDDLTQPGAHHRDESEVRDLEAWEDRSIPGRDLSNHDLMLRQRADDWKALQERYDDRALCESEEAMAAYWSGVFAQQPKWMADVWYEQGPG